MAKAKSFGKTGPRGLGLEKRPALPAWKAFVVQFTLETGVDEGVFAGRAEHLSTGQRVYFDSPRDLLEFVNAVLQQPPSGSG